MFILKYKYANAVDEGSRHITKNYVIDGIKDIYDTILSLTKSAEKADSAYQAAAAMCFGESHIFDKTNDSNDCFIIECVAKESLRAVIVECDYKGSYSRYALTPDEFSKDYINARPEMPEPDAEAQSFTTRPMVHIWYMLCDIYSDEFEKFFTDMTWGLCQSDIDNDNLAVIDLAECKSLRERVSEYI